MTLLWLTAMYPEARHLSILITSFILMSIGAGGVRPCTLAFGADQLNKYDDLEQSRVLSSFFGWYYAATSLSIIVAYSGIVYVQANLGYKLGFGIPVILMLLSTVMFIVTSPLYVKKRENNGLLTDLAQVIVVSFRNRKLKLPVQNSVELYHKSKGSDYVKPSERLR